MKLPVSDQFGSFFLSIAALAVFSISVQAQVVESDIKKPIDQLFEGMRSGDSAMVRSVFMKVNSFSTISKNIKDSVIVRPDGDAEGLIRAVGAPHKEIWDERFIAYK